MNWDELRQVLNTERQAVREMRDAVAVAASMSNEKNLRRAYAMTDAYAKAKQVTNQYLDSLEISDDNS